MKNTLWCATFIVWKDNTGMQLYFRFTYTDTHVHAVALMRSVIEDQPGVTSVILNSIHPLDRRTIFKTNLAVIGVARALENFGFTYVHAANRKSALFLLRKQLIG